MDKNKIKYTIAILLGSLLISLASILYLILGLTVIQDYVNESMFKSTQCTVRNVEIHNMNSKDAWYKCPWKCTVNHTPEGLKTACEISEFPCLRIVVDVATKFGMKSAILHESPEKMQKYQDCSTFYCDRDSVVNERDVNRFRSRYGKIGSKFACFYNLDSLDSDDYDDDGQEHALIRLSYSKTSYVNAWFWPSLAMLVGFLFLIYGFYFVYTNKRNNSPNRDHKRKLVGQL